MSEYIVDIADNTSFGGVLITCGEIVRCRDCVHFDSYGNTFGWCAFHNIDGSERRYCAWGESLRKDGGDD